MGGHDLEVKVKSHAKSEFHRDEGDEWDVRLKVKRFGPLVKNENPKDLFGFVPIPLIPFIPVNNVFDLIFCNVFTEG